MQPFVLNDIQKTTKAANKTIEHNDVARLAGFPCVTCQSGRFDKLCPIAIQYNTMHTVHYQGGHVQVQIKFPVFMTNFPVFFDT